MARVFVCVPPIISQILDFIYSTVLIFILIYFEWRDTENQQYGDMKQLASKPKFKVGDKVRISKYKRKIFDQGYTPNWTEEIFLVDKIQSTNPITYRLQDVNKEEIQGSFYEPELLKAKQDVFRIDKVIRRDYKKKEALVKWLGYSEDFNSWIPLSSLQYLSNQWHKWTII